jgi:hypothetical protein
MWFAQIQFSTQQKNPTRPAIQDFAGIDPLESNLCLPLALPVSEQLRTQSNGKA